jgi:PAS domain-containing protein
MEHHSPLQQAEASWRTTVHLRRLLEVLPAAAYTTDAEGLITFFNQRAVELWGRQPQVNDPIDRY